MTTGHPDVQVGALGAHDVDVLRRMLALFGEAFEDPATYGQRQPDDAYLRALLANPTFVAVAGCVGERVVAGLAGYVLPKFEQARSEFYLYDLAVDAAFRRRGLATALIAALRAHLRGRGVHVIFVQADREDDPAIALYTRLGTREDVLHFDIAP